MYGLNVNFLLKRYFLQISIEKMNLICYTYKYIGL